MNGRIVKYVSAALALLMIALAAVGCSANSADEIIGAVEYPESYHIVYDVEDANGVILTVSKTKDKNGNIRFCSGEDEVVFIKDGKSYIEYAVGADGEYESTKGKKVDEAYVEEATKAFSEYAERSREKFMPTVKEIGTDNIAERVCTVYEVSVGIKAFKVSYQYYVDDATGICLGFHAGMVLAGIEVDTNDETYTCVEFITENVEAITVE